MKLHSDENVVEKRGKYTPKSTTRSNNNAHRIMFKYLEECGYENTDYIHYPTQELNSILCKFWFSIHKQPKKDSKKRSIECFTENIDPNDNDNEGLYSKTTLENIRHALNRVFQDNRRPIDIITEHDFIESNKAYKDACKELKAKGKAVVKSYPEIVHAGKNINFCYRNIKFFEIELNDLHTSNIYHDYKTEHKHKSVLFRFLMNVFHSKNSFNFFKYN